MPEYVVIEVFRGVPFAYEKCSALQALNLCRWLMEGCRVLDGIYVQEGWS